MSKYILVIDNIVEAVFDDRVQGVGIEDQLIEVDSIPDVVHVLGKDYYFYYNGTEVEIRYIDKPLVEL